MSFQDTELEIHIYEEDDWAVKRWDWFNNGRKVTPKSFCQFWRCVFVWATLKQLIGWIPFLFWMFPATDQRIFSRDLKSIEKQNRPKPPPYKPPQFLYTIGNTFLLLLKPFYWLWKGICRFSRFFVVSILGSCIEWTAECCKKTAKWFDDRPWIVNMFNMFMVLLLSAVIVAIIVIGIYFAIHFGAWAWPRLDEISIYLASVVISIVIIALLLLWLSTNQAKQSGESLLSFLRGCGSAIYTTGMMIRAAKRGVCPPMEIRGRE